VPGRRPSSCDEPRRLLAVVVGRATAVTTRRSRARVQAT
jgi:hypothetical protein